MKCATLKSEMACLDGAGQELRKIDPKCEKNNLRSFDDAWS
jgi:hypothetical protein